MPMTVACKLPHGLSVLFAGKTLNLNGANADADPLAPVANGLLGDTANTMAGYGLTTLSDDDAKVFEEWRLNALYRKKDDKAAEANGMLDEPFLPLTNGSIQTFKSTDEARSRLRRGDQLVTTGFEGIDGDAEMKSAAASTALVESGTDKSAGK